MRESRERLEMVVGLTEKVRLLVLVHIHAEPANLLLLQGLVEGLGVHKGATGGVDDDHGGLHQGNGLFIDHI